MDQNYYQILGVSPEAPEKEIKRAYHTKARQIHPDKATSPEERAKFEEQFALISKAYNVLKEGDKRVEYDRQQKILQEKPPEITNPQPLSSKKRESITPSASPISKGGLSQAKQQSINISERAKIAQKAFNKGMQLFQSGDYAKAIEFFEAAISNDDSDPNYFVRIALALIRSHKSLTKALDYMRTAIEMDPYNIEYKHHLAEIYESAGALSSARQVYQEILKWDTTNEKAMRKLTLMGFQDKKSGSFFTSFFKKIFKK